MRHSEFHRLRTFEDEKDMKDLKVGDCFLYGQRVIAQKTNKKIGDPISYYQVIGVTETGGIEYTPIFDNLIKDKESD